MTSTDGLRNAVQRYQAARPVMRRPMRDSATAIAQELAAERNALVARLEKRWTWLDGNAGHAQFSEREDALLDDLATYEAMEDALRDAAAVLYGSAA